MRDEIVNRFRVQLFKSVVAEPCAGAVTFFLVCAVPHVTIQNAHTATENWCGPVWTSEKEPKKTKKIVGVLMNLYCEYRIEVVWVLCVCPCWQPAADLIIESSHSSRSQLLASVFSTFFITTVT
jgi:hypothetical protein